MPDLLFFLLFGHFLGDYALQSDSMARNKRTSNIVLTAHVLVYTVTIALMLALGTTQSSEVVWSSSYPYIWLGCLFVEHWMQDFIRQRWFGSSRQGLYIDQCIHVAVLFALRIYVFTN